MASATRTTQNPRNTQSNHCSARSAISALIVLAVALSLSSSATAAGRPITITDLLALQRVSDPQVCRDEACNVARDKEREEFKTPTLVIAGEQDYRVPYTQSPEFFTALQRQGVPSRLVLFPDEGHWINRPQNSAVWCKEFLGWLARYLAPEGTATRSVQ